MYNYSELKKVSVPSPSKSKSKDIKSKTKRLIKSLSNKYPFISSLLKAFDKIISSKHKINLSESNEALFILIGVATISFWILVFVFCVGALLFNAPLDLEFDANTSKDYNEWIQIEGIDIKSVDHDLDHLLNITEKLHQMYNITVDFDDDLYHEFSTSLMDTVTKHCIDELHFELDEASTDEIITQIDALIWHLALNQTLNLKPGENHNDFVITKHGFILNKEDITNLNDKQENNDYGYCSLITEIYKKFDQKHLIQIINVKDFGYESVANSDLAFNATDKRGNYEIWETDYKHLFLLNDVNHDSYRFIHEAMDILHESTIIEANKHRYVHTLSYYLLHNYCSEIFNHLGGNHGYKKHEIFIQSIIDYVSKMSSVKQHDSIDGIPVIDKNGFFAIVQKDIHLANDDEYETCPFIKNVVFYHYGSISHQIDDVLKSFRKVSVFDIKMEMLLQQYCYNLVHQLQKQNNDIYHSQFKYALYEFISDLMNNHNQQISKFHNVYTNPTNGDITNKFDNKYIQCTLLSEMIKSKGMNIYPSDNDFKYQFDITHGNNDNDEHDHALEIYKLAKLNDVLRLKTEIRHLLVKFYDKDIKKHFEFNSREYYNILDILISEIEQYVIRLVVETKAKHKQNIVIMDISAGVVMDIEKDRINTLSHNWIELSVLNKIIDLHRNDLQNALKERNDKIDSVPVHTLESESESDSKSKSESESETESEIEDASSINELNHFVDTLWKDVQQVNKDKIVEEFDEDVVHGLNEFCKSMMKQISSSFVKRQLRVNILSKVLIQKKEIKDPIITDKGEIVSYHDIHDQQTQIFKCQFVQALINKISQSV